LLEKSAQVRPNARRNRADAPPGKPLRTSLFPGLDLLRGFAAISVVIYHVIELFDWPNRSGDNLICHWFRLGWMGVDLFFVISGFVITLSALRLFDLNPAGFARTYCSRRLARIVPLHYLTCLLFVVFLTPALLSYRRFWWHALAHLTFIHGFSPNTHGSINGANWSLSVEMQFYVLILLLVPFLRRMRPMAVLAACIATSWIWRALIFRFVHGQGQGGINLTWFAVMQLPGTLDEFGFGIALAIGIHRDFAGRLTRRLHAVRWLWPVVAVSAATVTLQVFGMNAAFWESWPLVVFWRTLLGATCTLVVISACAIDDGWFLAATAPLRYLGTISYGIYLWHLLVIIAIRPLLVHQPARACLWTLGLTVVLAALSWHFFEKPLMERLANIDFPDRARGSRFRVRSRPYRIDTPRWAAVKSYEPEAPASEWISFGRGQVLRARSASE
jgi:peptidoglycan/LPS O-acetylase OafA/YrhL